MSILGKPLFEAANVLVEKTQLRERLRALPEDDFEDLSGDLQALLASASAAEAERTTLSEFAEALRTHFYDARETRPSTRDALQLITSQKAKGSEWQAVIVPFFAREVRSAPLRYPRLVRQRKTGEMTLLLDKGDLTKELEAALDLEERQEMERLLYVALTRARHTLVLAADHELFAKRNGELHSSCQMKWFRADENGTNRAAVENVAVAAVACEKTTAQQKKTAEIKGEKMDKQMLPHTVDAKAAHKNACAFVQTVNPSGLPREEIGETDGWSENLKTPAAFSPALRYGVWWHEFMQQLPWDSDGKSWKEIFERNKTASPDAARSKREWELLEKLLAADLDFRRRIARDIIHKEMPILWRIDQTRCLEGIVDLALFQAEAKKVFILDWKTNRIAPDKIDSLRARYRPQMAAYWKAIQDMTNHTTKAAIYSTATGFLIAYDQDELAKEWDRLRQLPPNEFVTKLQSPEA